MLLVIFIVIGARLNELFLVSIRYGKILVVRGRVPSALLGAFSDVARDAHIERATIRAVRAADHARLLISGADERVAQRLRSVFGTHPIQKLRAAPAPPERNVGQLIGWTWLVLTRR